ncbi:MAG TPA: hypothetical protein PLY93_00210 [Turneriella sp.]|nr:hypothetical protein [Turneriella sp.]
MHYSNKIFLGVTEIAGYYAGLQKGLCELGYQCNHYLYFSHPFKYSQPSRSLLCNIIRMLIQLHNRLSHKNHFFELLKLLLFPSRLIFQALFFFSCIFKFDIFIFGYCTSFFSPLPKIFSCFEFSELYLLKLLGRKIIFVMHGSDVRPPYMDGTYQGVDIKTFVSLNKERKKRITRLEKLANYIVCDPAYAAYFTKSVINRSYIMCPASVIYKADDILQRTDNKAPFSIVHAPSAPSLKGTLEIQKAIQNLKRQGYRIRYTEIINQSNQKVIETILSSDMVIDQLYSDIPLPGLASESALLGRAVVMGIYDQKFVLGQIDAKARPPVCYVYPESIEEELLKILKKGRHFIFKQGKKLQKFAYQNITPLVVAKRFELIFENRIPGKWWYNPNAYDYIFGCVITKKRLFSNIKKIINEFGISALQMNDKPQYLKKLLSRLKN